MDDKEIQKLQRYIGKRSKGQTDSEVIVHIEKICAKQDLTSDEWEKMLFPLCANGDITILDYVLQHLDALSDPKEYILHTVRFRNTADGYEQKQVHILERLFSYVLPEEKQEILNEAMELAAWFGEYEPFKYLVEQGADLSYHSDERSVLELSRNAVERFGDNRVEEMILKMKKGKRKKFGLFSIKTRL